ncbi:hemin-degrading factor [Rhabdobacter roseus]|uniref:Putative hemin transport protein n=1 Tax=Rhabdobacter roseus TaxID=1655419 RepID=A0A840TQ46_9BACT|nr:ChuX/HutX family heme-like substrate-binding protein [Rhabdobacter roseus]MBB5282138.1 putative hemin transport protein [Rhabdobacter roseus]
MKTTPVSERSSLKEAWNEFRLQNPKVRIRDAAKQLNSTEAELLATGIGESVVRLEGDFRDVIQDVAQLGHVMALTRNDHVVHERKGTYEKISFRNQVGLVLGEDIDLRLFMTHWHFGFAVNENERQSLQFFDQNGEAVHKIYLTEQSDRAAYQALVAKYEAADQEAAVVTQPLQETEEAYTAKDEAELAAFQQEWLGLQDTHDFFGLIRKYGLPRQEALRHAPEGYAYRFDPASIRQVFQDAADTSLPIMVFVGSRGCIQIHTGPVKKLVVTGPWFNVLDPEFNLHLREDAIHEAWVVIKPTVDGVVTALELFDAQGEIIVQVFGKRKPGSPELEAWRSIVQNAASPLQIS